MAEFGTFHVLKTWPEYFDRVVNGDAVSVISPSDRDFQVGDEVVFEYYNPDPEDGPQSYPAPSCRKVITYVLPGGQFGIEEGYCVFGIADVEGE